MADEQPQQKSRGRKPKAEQGTKRTYTAMKKTSRPKAKAKAKARSKPGKAKAKATPKAKGKQSQAKAKCKAKAKSRPRAANESERNLQSKKSSAYHAARKQALRDGHDDETAKAKGREAWSSFESCICCALFTVCVTFQMHQFDHSFMCPLTF